MTEAIKPGQLYEILPDGRWAIYLDATMCGTLGVCPQLFKYSFIDSLVLRGDRPWARDLGSWWSEVMEHTYGAFAKGVRLNGEQLVKIALETWIRLDMDQLEKVHPKSYKSFGGKMGAIQMISEYGSSQLPIDYASWKIVAAEASFGRNREVCIGETSKVVLYWMGQPDLFVITNGTRVCPVDHKSIAKIDYSSHLKYKPHIQLPGYIVAAQIILKAMNIDLPVDRVIVNAVARTDSNDKNGEKRPRFKRFLISYTESELAEWKQRRLDQAEELRGYIETGRFQWHEYACTSQWGRACAFQDVDSKPPGTRDILLSTNFTKRAPWIPGRTKSEAEEKGE